MSRTQKQFSVRLKCPFEVSDIMEGDFFCPMHAQSLWINNASILWECSFKWVMHFLNTRSASGRYAAVSYFFHVKTLNAIMKIRYFSIADFLQFESYHVQFESSTPCLFTLGNSINLIFVTICSVIQFYYKKNSLRFFSVMVFIYSFINKFSWNNSIHSHIHTHIVWIVSEHLRISRSYYRRAVTNSKIILECLQTHNIVWRKFNKMF